MIRENIRRRGVWIVRKISRAPFWQKRRNVLCRSDPACSRNPISTCVCRILDKTRTYSERLSARPEMRNAFLFSRTSSAKKLRARRAEHCFYILLCFTICSYLISRHVSSTNSRRGIFIGVDQWEGTRCDERPREKNIPAFRLVVFLFLERENGNTKARRKVLALWTKLSTTFVIFVTTETQQRGSPVSTIRK